MGTFSVWHILIVAAIILLLFGGQGKISDLMGDVGRGIKALREGLAHPQNDPAEPHAPDSGASHDLIDAIHARDIAAGRDREPIGNKTASPAVLGR